MDIVLNKSPHIRKKASVSRMMLDVLIALLPVVVFSFVMNGINALKVILISVVIMLLSEFIFVGLKNMPPKNVNDKCNKNEYPKLKDRINFKVKVFKKNTKIAYSHFTINNILAPMVSAIIFAMIMPASASWYVVAVSSLFGIVVGKLVFGGLGSNIFNPAAAGRIFAGICFGSTFTYSGNSYYDIIAGGTPLGQFQDSLINISNYSLFDLFIGTVPGALGETSALCILIGAAYLFIRRSADIRPFISMLATFFALMLCAGLFMDASSCLEYATYHLLSGGLLFGAVFMVTDPVTTPNSKIGRINYGIIVAILVVILRLSGTYPEGVAFAILLGNILTPLLDSPKLCSNSYKWYYIVSWVSVISISILIMYFALPSMGVIL